MGATHPLELVVKQLRELEQARVITEWAIGGAGAVIFHAEPISTADLDVFAIFPSEGGGLISLGPLYRELISRGFRAEGDAINIAGIPVQVLPAPGPLYEEAIREAQVEVIGQEELRVFSAEHLVAIALSVGRAKDKLRIAHLRETGKRPLDMQRLEDILLRHGLREKWRAYLSLAGEP